jgi:hypothetical protein
MDTSILIFRRCSQSSVKIINQKDSKKIRLWKFKRTFDVYRSRQEQIDIIEERRQFQKINRKNKKRDQRSQHYSDLYNYKRFKAKKAEEQSEG